MAVVIDSGPVDATDRVANVPPAKWRELVAARRMFCAVHLPYDCRELLRFVDEAADMVTTLGYRDVRDLIERGLELDPSLVEWAIHGLKRLQPHEPITFARAVQLGKRGAPKGNRNAAKDKGNDINKVSDAKFVSESPYSRDYILARLERDGHTELVEQVTAGELSAHAAALHVGYRRSPDPFKQLQKWWAKADSEERTAFVQWITHA